MVMFYIGIDPGRASGGIAVIDLEGKLATTTPMPETEADVSAFLEDYAQIPSVILAMIEKVHPMPAAFVKDGEMRRQGISSTFKFGQNYGFLRGVLTALKIPFEDVPPVTWQRFCHCLTHGDKNISKARAQRLFPGIKITHK